MKSDYARIYLPKEFSPAFGETTTTGKQENLIDKWTTSPHRRSLVFYQWHPVHDIFVLKQHKTRLRPWTPSPADGWSCADSSGIILFVCYPMLQHIFMELWLRNHSFVHAGFIARWFFPFWSQMFITTIISAIVPILVGKAIVLTQDAKVNPISIKLTFPGLCRRLAEFMQTSLDDLVENNLLSILSWISKNTAITINKQVWEDEYSADTATISRIRLIYLQLLYYSWLF